MADKKKTKKFDADFISEIAGVKKKKHSFFSSKKNDEKKTDHRNEMLTKLRIDLSGDVVEKGDAGKKLDLGLDDSDAGGNSDANSNKDIDEGVEDEADEMEKAGSKTAESDVFINLKDIHKEKKVEGEFDIWDKVRESKPDFSFKSFAKPKVKTPEQKKETYKLRSSMIEENIFESKNTGKKYVLFAGCSADGAQRSLYLSAKFVFSKLGIELVEPPEFSCCGGTVVDDRNHDLMLALNARNFAIAQKYDADILVLSGTCLKVMNDARHRIESDEGIFENVNQIISKAGLHYKRGLKIKNVSGVVANEIDKSLFREKIVLPLKDLRVAPFYGCHMRIEKEKINYEFDDPENPKSFEQVISMVGASACDFEMKMNCCGFHIQPNEPKTCYKMTGEILKNVEDAGADVVVSPSPFCHSILDACQGKARSYGRVKAKIPVLHLTELIAISMGAAWKDIGLNQHSVSLKRIIKRFGIPKKSL